MSRRVPNECFLLLQCHSKFVVHDVCKNSGISINDSTVDSSDLLPELLDGVGDLCHGNISARNSAHLSDHCSSIRHELSGDSLVEAELLT